MAHSDRDRAIALAGMYQAAFMVRDIARTGLYDGDDFATCVASLMKIDAADSADVYGGLGRIKTGLRLLTEQLNQPRDMEVTRYLLGLFTLERKLSARADLLERIRRDIEVAAAKLDHFPLTHENTIAALAETYVSTVSTLTPRIMVNGEPVHLNRSDNAARIRVLLLAGMRSAILWRQSGGSRWALIWRRKAIINAARELLRELKQAAAAE